MINDTIMRQCEAARYLKMSYEHLGVLRRRGQGPAYVPMGRFFHYRKVDLDAWVAARVVGKRAA